MASLPVGVTPTTVGVYVDSAGVPFLSTRWIDTPVPRPVKFGSGVKVTSPVFGSIV